MHKPTCRINDTFNNNIALEIITLVRNTETPTLYQARKLIESVGKIIRTNYVRRVNVVGLKKAHKIKSIEEGKTKSRCKAGDIVLPVTLYVDHKSGSNANAGNILNARYKNIPHNIQKTTVSFDTPVPNFAPHTVKQSVDRINRTSSSIKKPKKSALSDAAKNALIDGLNKKIANLKAQV